MASVWDTLELVSRTASRSRLARLGPRLVFAAVAMGSVVAGVVAGCGIDYEGSLLQDVEAGEKVGAVLPPSEGGADGSTDAAPGDGGLDATPDANVKCAESQCADAGGVCDSVDETCTFRCDGGATSCATGITCPPGVPCHVVCAGDDSCAGKIDCTQATACDIGCLGKHTCGGVACAGTNCTVRCNGMDSCRSGGVHCTATTECNIVCAGSGKMNCQDPITCTSASCAVRCNAEGCRGGVTANAADASIFCGADACEDGGATCFGQFCELACKSGRCMNELCCDAGTCIIDGGPNNCP